MRSIRLLVLLPFMLLVTGCGATLHHAAKEGDTQRVMALLEKGADVNTKDTEGNTPLHKAVESSHKELVELLIQEKAHVNARNSVGETPLNMAAQEGWWKLAKLLIQNGADVRAAGHDGITPLHDAAGTGQKEAGILLIQKGANAHAKDSIDWTPLHWAAASGANDMARLLIQKGADVNARGDSGKIPMIGKVYTRPWVRSKHETIEMFYLWSPSGDRSSSKEYRLLCFFPNWDGLVLSGEGFGYISYSVSVKDEALRDLDFRAQRDLLGGLRMAWTPLHMAVQQGQKETAELLIEIGADINAEDTFGETPLHYAVGRGDMQLTEFLIQKGADVKSTARVGWTPLHCVAANGSKELARLLIQKGADVNARDNFFGETPLHTAIRDGEKAFNIGLGILQITSDKRNASRDEKKAELTELLIVNGADLNAVSTAGQTALMYAALTGNSKIVETLLQKGADINVISKSGMTALGYAEEKEHPHIVQMLMAAGASEEQEPVALSDYKADPKFFDYYVIRTLTGNSP